MVDRPEPPPIVCVVGPTGTGKNWLALHLAQSLDIAIVNADSRQVYRDFPVVTAQPDAQERSVCPHYLYGFLPTSDKVDAGSFVRMAREVIAEVLDNGRLPVLVGGTGLYLRALVHGLAPTPPIPESIRKKVASVVRHRGRQWAHRVLSRLDPEWAAKVHPNDRQRVTRGLEVRLATGTPLSQWHRQQTRTPRYNALTLGLDTDLAALTPRLESRIRRMLDAGAEDEAHRAWARCPDPDAPGWTGIGCAELLAMIRGQLSREEACRLWLQNTRAYAKRQMTWFRKESEVFWVQPDARQWPLELVSDWLQSARG